MTADDLLAGRYRTLRVIGSGGMARVFLADDERLGRRVAVKRLHAESPEDTARRFQREARIGASLNHHNLVTVYDVDTDGESVLIVMEYVEGTTLADELRSGALPEERVAADRHGHRRGAGLRARRGHRPSRRQARQRAPPAKDGAAKLADLGIATAAESTRITSAARSGHRRLHGAGAGPRAPRWVRRPTSTRWRRWPSRRWRGARRARATLRWQSPTAGLRARAATCVALWPGAAAGVVEVL